MKRIFLCVAFAAVMTTAFSQDQNQALGFELGFTRPLIREALSASSTKLSDIIAMNGMKVGVVYDANLIKGFGLTIGVHYNIANSYTKWQDGTGLTKYPQTREQYLMHSIDLPIDWRYKFKIADETYLIVYTGPSFEYSFTLRHSSYTRTFDQTVTRVDDNYFEIDRDGDMKKDYSRFALRWGVGGGFQFQNYYLRGGYDFGIRSLYTDRYDNQSEYTRRGRYDGWNVRVGIYFLNF